MVDAPRTAGGQMGAAAAGLADPLIATETARLDAPSAAGFSECIGFAPGMAAMMEGLGQRRSAVLERFVENLEMRLGRGPIDLSGVAFIGTAHVLRLWPLSPGDRRARECNLRHSGAGDARLLRG